jgi:hypothetical protein
MGQTHRRVLGAETWPTGFDKKLKNADMNDPQREKVVSARSSLKSSSSIDAALPCCNPASGSYGPSHGGWARPDFGGRRPVPSWSQGN